MKRRHVSGTKRERTGASDWYKAIEEEHIRSIEQEWQVKQAMKSTTRHLTATWSPGTAPRRG